MPSTERFIQKKTTKKVQAQVDERNKWNRESLFIKSNRMVSEMTQKYLNFKFWNGYFHRSAYLIIKSVKCILAFDIKGWMIKSCVSCKGVTSRMLVFKTKLYQDIIGDSDVGDNVMLVTLWWWLIWDVGGWIIMLVTFCVMLVIFWMY